MEFLCTSCVDIQIYVKYIDDRTVVNLVFNHTSSCQMRVKYKYIHHLLFKRTYNYYIYW